MEDNNQKQNISNEKNQEKEIGGYKGPDPTKYGDWQHNGKTTDF